ncbi:aminoglycoside phosphotransferase family protein [uncultured Agrococcus sp.]|uniref:aminoglycoside phosphotransferase family protein n=1 Tax=uncultured Agrococcus sp. TaxID=382258 RepID=UPI0025DA7DD1|nr:aminoglycoside phosphotransferase family protein [uncultured Agrococcus sp.]
MSFAEELTRQAAGLDDRFGADRAAEFSLALPDLVDRLLRDWQLRSGDRISAGATSVVIDVTDAAGELSVLKLSPDAEFLARQAGMLRHFAPTGRVPLVRKSSEELGAVLLERVIPGVESDEDLPSLQDWAALLRELHDTDPSGIEEALDARCFDMFERIGARQRMPEVREHIPDTVWEAAVELCRSLLASTDAPAAIHGDLHLGNALTSERRGLVAIDPKLCVGDRCFDMVDFVIATGGPEEFTQRVHELARLTGVTPDRLLAWSRVNAVVTAISRTRWNGFTSRSADLLSFAGFAA